MRQIHHWQERRSAGRAPMPCSRLSLLPRLPCLPDQAALHLHVDDVARLAHFPSSMIEAGGWSSSSCIAESRPGERAKLDLIPRLAVSASIASWFSAGCGWNEPIAPLLMPRLWLLPLIAVLPFACSASHLSAAAIACAGSGQKANEPHRTPNNALHLQGPMLTMIALATASSLLTISTP
jgi:hypothetical protein